MVEETIYKADDGAVFTEAEKCVSYENYLNKTKAIMSRLKTRKDESGYAVRQDVTVVKQAMKDFFDEVAKPLLNWNLANQMMDETVEGKRHMSHIARVFDDCSEFPLLRNTFFRFMCINMTSGIEYEQPYYVEHEKDFPGTIE